MIADKRDPVLATAPFCRLDVTDPASLQRLPATETIVNLAAEHRDDVRPVSRYQETNVDGARNVCELAEQRGVRSSRLRGSTAPGRDALRRSAAW